MNTYTIEKWYCEDSRCPECGHRASNFYQRRNGKGYLKETRSVCADCMMLEITKEDSTLIITED
jgi:hypothetical protein